MTAYKAPCQHGRYDRHDLRVTDSKGELVPPFVCPGGTLLPPDSLVIVKEDGEWPEWALTATGCSKQWGWDVERYQLDALAMAAAARWDS